MPSNLAVQNSDWEAAKASVASGVSLKAVSDKLGLDYELLKKRAQREAWDRPHLAVRKAKQAHRTIREAANNDGQKVSTTTEEPSDGQDLSRSVPKRVETQVSDVKSRLRDMSAEEKTGTVIMESAQELAESGSFIGLKLLHGQIKEAQDNQHNLAPIVDAKGIVTAIRGMRLAGGLDKQGPVVALSLWSGQPPPKTAPREVGEIEGWVDTEE